jgi:mono/diheme cytochrome c family protein
MRKTALAVAAALSLCPTAFAQSPERGAELARRWCANCHVVEGSPAAASADGLPSFPALANAPGQSADHLRATMNPQHSRMPDFALSKRQQDDLVSYILSLRKR